jgi:hypothetical protein
MVTFKKYRELLNENYILLLEERIRNIVKVRLDDLVRNSSCYERHRKDVSDYATNSKENLYIVYLFVIFTIQKSWPTVVDFFPTFLEIVFDVVVNGNIRNVDDMKRYAEQSGDEMKEKVFRLGGMHYGSIFVFWDNIDEIFDAVQELKDDPLTLYTWLVKYAPGLSAAKAGFYMQLIIGEFGCFDSVNQKLYGSKMNRLLQTEGKGKGTFRSAPEGDTDAAVEKLVNYLRDYEITMKEILGSEATKKMWDIWCSIIEHRVESAKYDSKDNTIFKFSYQGDEFEGEIEPYKHYTDKPYIVKAKESGRYKSKTGETVSGEHAGLLRHGFGKFGK